MKLLSLAACAGAAMAFADTAPLFASLDLALPNTYMVKAAELNAAFAGLSKQFCSASSDKLVVYRVAQLLSKKLGLPLDAYSVKHVHYNSGSEIDLSLDSACSVQYMSELPADISTISANVLVVDIDDDAQHTVGEFSSHKNYIVQGKPSFHKAGARGESIKEFLNEKLHLDFNEPHKREVETLETDEAAMMAEISDDFAKAKSLISAEESDAMVTALADDSDLAMYSAAAKNSTSKSNLFTNYQFFTPGVWLALIVSLFLVFVASTAVNWITSIELSYKSFEKQVEYEKKTE